MVIPTRAPCVALDVGGSSVKAALVEAGNDVSGLSVTQFSIEADADQEQLGDVFARAIRSVAAGTESALDRIAWSFPGPANYNAGVSYVSGLSKFESLYGESLADIVGPRLGRRPVMRFRNDAEAAVIGEARFGAAAGVSKVLGLTIGTGLGSCVSDNGYPGRVSNDYAPNGWLYAVPVGNSSAEEVFSTRGLMSRLEAAGSSAASVAHAALMAREGCATECTIFVEFGSLLGSFVGTWSSEYGVEACVILGGIAGAADLFVPYASAQTRYPILVGKLGTRAAISGAALLFS